VQEKHLRSVSEKALLAVAPLTKFWLSLLVNLSDSHTHTQQHQLTGTIRNLASTLSQSTPPTCVSASFPFHSDGVHESFRSLHDDYRGGQSSSTVHKREHECSFRTWIDVSRRSWPCDHDWKAYPVKYATLQTNTTTCFVISMVAVRSIPLLWCA
jgi:hypothetical protein